MLRNSQSAEKGEDSQTFQKYFDDLKKKFDEENDLVADLNAILQNYNEIGILKGKITRLRGEIDIAELMLEEKELCAKERDEIRKFQKNEGEIKALMANLREKKNDKNNVNNKYCEGVAKKLEDRVKKVLMTYDYTFECAEGLEELKLKRDNDKRELIEAEARLKELENSAGIDEYKRKFEDNRKFIKEKHSEVASFKINEYHHNPAEIAKLIEKTESDL